MFKNYQITIYLGKGYFDKYPQEEWIWHAGQADKSNGYIGFGIEWTKYGN